MPVPVPSRVSPHDDLLARQKAFADAMAAYVPAPVPPPTYAASITPSVHPTIRPSTASNLPAPTGLPTEDTDGVVLPMSKRRRVSPAQGPSGVEPCESGHVAGLEEDVNDNFRRDEVPATDTEDADSSSINHAAEFLLRMESVNNVDECEDNGDEELALNVDEEASGKYTTQQARNPTS
jgi:hypothetical protein